MGREASDTVQSRSHVKARGGAVRYQKGRASGFHRREHSQDHRAASEGKGEGGWAVGMQARKGLHLGRRVSRLRAEFPH